MSAHGTTPRASARGAPFSRLWQGELGYAHAAVAIAGAAAVGWGIELARGGRPLAAPSWPGNAIFLGMFVAWLWLLSRMPGRVVPWLGGVPFALMSMLAVGVLGAVGGIVPQVAEDAPAWARGLGFDHIFGGAPFAVAMLLLLTNLGLATFRKVRVAGARAWLFSLNHVGLWVVLACGMFGAGDITRARMVVAEGQAEAMVVDAQGRHGYLPFGILLQRFYVEQYPDDAGRPGAPKKFAAEVTLLKPDKSVEEARIEVNKPLRRDGWTLYLTNYELSANGLADQCLIEAVRDPWLPGVYTGIFLLLGGALAMLFRSPFEGREA